MEALPLLVVSQSTCGTKEAMEVTRLEKTIQLGRPLTMSAKERVTPVTTVTVLPDNHEELEPRDQRKGKKHI